MKTIVALAMLFACVTAAERARAQDTGDVIKGATIARQNCAECHAVEKAQLRSPNSQAPAFKVVATTPGMTSLALTAALRTSHRDMPNIILANEELRNVIAYVVSLQ